MQVYFAYFVLPRQSSNTKLVIFDHKRLQKVPNLQLRVAEFRNMPNSSISFVSSFNRACRVEIKKSAKRRKRPPPIKRTINLMKGVLKRQQTKVVMISGKERGILFYFPFLFFCQPGDCAKQEQEREERTKLVRIWENFALFRKKHICPSFSRAPARPKILGSSFLRAFGVAILVAV